MFAGIEICDGILALKRLSAGSQLPHAGVSSRSTRTRQAQLVEFYTTVRGFLLVITNKASASAETTMTAVPVM
jgi:hypothetical protein